LDDHDRERDEREAEFFPAK
jgi:hypothetical protein